MNFVGLIVDRGRAKEGAKREISRLIRATLKAASNFFNANSVAPHIPPGRYRTQSDNRRQPREMGAT